MQDKSEYVESIALILCKKIKFKSLPIPVRFLNCIYSIFS